MLFAVASTLVNCTNSYDHEEPDPQMLELAKYAKQHVPEQHPKVRRGAGLRPKGFLHPAGAWQCGLGPLGGKGLMGVSGGGGLGRAEPCVYCVAVIPRTG